jgi:hypothetical protein
LRFVAALLVLAGSPGHAKEHAKPDLAALVQVIASSLPASAGTIDEILASDPVAGRARPGYNPQVYRTSDGYDIRVTFEAEATSAGTRRVVRTTLGVDAPACVDQTALRRELTELAGWTWTRYGSRAYISRPRKRYVEISVWPGSNCVVGIVVDADRMLRPGPPTQPAGRADPLDR